MSKPKVLYAPTPSHTERVFARPTWEQFNDEFDLTDPRGEKALTAVEIAAQIAGHDALVTGWGVPALTEEVFANADKLKVVAHSAGSIKYLVTDEFFDRYLLPKGITLFSAYQMIALNVAECTIGMLIMAARHFVPHALRYWEHGTRSADIPKNGQYLRGGTIGIVSASAVGREVIRLLEPFGCHVLVYDPYLSAEGAAELGVETVELNALFERSDHVTLHAPSTPETEKMIGAEQLKRLRDGAAFVNTSRGSAVDHDALLQEAGTGRIQVVLDVTTPEPLPADSAFRELRNVMITPHLAGAGYYGYHKIGEATAQAVRDALAGRPVAGAISRERYAVMA
jgi:phosphoglycerate dehydrogenase-like enzyme